MPLPRVAPATLLLLVLACSPGGNPTPAPQQPPDPGGTAAAGTAAPDDAVVAQPAAQVDVDCSPQPRQGEDGPELVAHAEVVNTGDLGVKVRLVARWPQPQGKGLIRTRRVNVAEGERRQVTLRIAVGEPEAEAVRERAKQGRTCSATHRVIGAFGAPGDG